MPDAQITEIASFYQKRFGYNPPDASFSIHPEVKLIIVIPCFNEPALLDTLNSIRRCDPPQFPIQIIIVINASQQASHEITAQNATSEKEAENWIHAHANDKLNVHLMRAYDLPAKHAGVGLARKIGMDEALYKFGEIGYNGLIVCLDADCTVEKNYLQILEKHFISETPKSITLYFEHNLEAVEDSLLKEGIVRYELFLRYYVNALRFCGFPYAFHTIGSSMGVRADIYAKTGGMNRRKAGEDFYFLHKVAPQGELLEIRDTTVFPSARISDRVPFGTGKAQFGWVSNSNTEYLTYNPLIFKDLRVFLSSINELFENISAKAYVQWRQMQPTSIKAFLAKENFEAKMREFRNQTTQVTAFHKRFYAWMDGFKVLKLVHFVRDNFYPQVPIEEASRQLLLWQTGQDVSSNVEDLLMIYRKLDKNLRSFPKKSG